MYSLPSSRSLLEVVMDSTWGLVPPDDEIQSIFWDCLSDAENSFGPKRPELQYEVRITEEKKYPETINYGTKVLVCFTRGRSRIGYNYEAGHEAVHCLTGVNHSTYLEEAVATAFALHKVRSTFGQDGVDKCQVSSDYQQSDRSCSPSRYRRHNIWPTGA